MDNYCQKYDNVQHHFLIYSLCPLYHKLALLLQSHINTEKFIILFIQTQREEMLFYYLQYKAFQLPIKYMYFWTKCQPENSIPSPLIHEL